MNHPLRITLVEFAPSGGLYQYAYLLGRTIAEHGHSVTLLTGPDPELGQTVSGLTLRPVLPTWHPDGTGPRYRVAAKARRVWRAFQYVSAWRHVWAHMARERPDVVQWADLRFALDGVMILALARRFPGSVLVDLAHTPRPLAEQRRGGSLYKSGPFVRHALARAAARLDAVVVLGQRSRDELLAALPQARRVEIIPHGTYTPLLASPVASPGACARRALFFGTWTRYKGLELLLEAWSELRPRLPDAELVLAGVVGADVDGPAIIRRACAAGGVSIQAGYVAMADLPALVGSARLVVTPYLAANQSGVVHLAQCLGRPVVATDVGDLGQAVRDGETGLLVSPGDASALAAAMEQLFVDPGQADRLGKAAKDAVDRHGSWDRIGEQFVELYRDLARARRHLDRGDR